MTGVVLPRARATGTALRRRAAPTTVLWVVLSAATVAALCTTDSLPFYDYYQWLYQGHVVAVLLFGVPDPGVAAGGYALSPVPVPNLAAPVLIGLLNVVLPVEAAGQVVVIATALGFAGAFGHLVRTLQRRPTPAEFLGFPWALGFFLYKGYLSYELGVAGMFVLVAVLHRFARRPSRRGLAVVAGLGLLLYLSHLLAWLMGGLAVVVHAAVLARRGRWRPAVPLVLCLTPGVVLVGWYVLAEHGGTGITLYPSVQDKAIALTETFQFFLRLDPFPPRFPLPWVNAVLALAVAAVALVPLDVRYLGRALATRPVLWLSAALAVVALVLPISTVNDLIKPDERFIAPAVLLAVAAVPYRPVRRRVAALGAGLAAAVVGLHAVEYTDVGRRIEAVDATIPGQARVLHLTVPSRYGCTASRSPVTGVPVLKWYAVDHALEGGPAGVNIDETSVVRTPDPAALSTTVLAPDTPDVAATVRPHALDHPYIDVVGCRTDLDAVERSLTPAYRPVVHGDVYTIFVHR